VPDSLYQFLIQPSSGPIQYIVEVTPLVSEHLPPTGALGYPVPKGSSCKWSVFSFGPYKSTDEVAGPNHVPGASEGTTTTSSNVQSFNTAP